MPADDVDEPTGEEYNDLTLTTINGWRVSHIQHGSKRESRRLVLAKQLKAAEWCSRQVKEGTRHMDPVLYAQARERTAVRLKRRAQEVKDFREKERAEVDGLGSAAAAASGYEV